MTLKYPIAIGLSPNTQDDDVREAFKIILQPWSWKEGKAIKKVEQWFKDYFQVQDAIAFNSGRSALYALLKIFNIGVGDEVLIQAFTCVAVADPIIWAGAIPIYIDIDETLNINSGLIEKHISKKTRAIIVQHTFGIPAKIDVIKKIAQKYNFVLIEDCAHSLGATYNGKKVGTFGDAAFFSFGRDKIVSSVFGGMAVISLKFKVQSSKLKDFQKQLKYPSHSWILQQLFHPLAFAIILPLYNIFSLGKILLFLLQKLRLLSKPVQKEEMDGEKPIFFPARYPNSLASILLLQLKKLNKYNEIRRKNAAYYYKLLKQQKDIIVPDFNPEGIYLRFNIFTDKAVDILQNAGQQKIILGNWYKNTIDPKGVDFDKVAYKIGSCPKAEEAAKLSVNLPTYPRLTRTDLDSVINMLKIYEN